MKSKILFFIIFVLSTVLDQTLASIAFRKQTESLQNRETDKTGSGNGVGYDGPAEPKQKIV